MTIVSGVVPLEGGGQIQMTFEDGQTARQDNAAVKLQYFSGNLEENRWSLYCFMGHRRVFYKIHELFHNGTLSFFSKKKKERHEAEIFTFMGLPVLCPWHCSGKLSSFFLSNPTVTKDWLYHCPLTVEGMEIPPSDTTDLPWMMFSEGIMLISHCPHAAIHKYSVTATLQFSHLLACSLFRLNIVELSCIRPAAYGWNLVL